MNYVDNVYGNLLGNIRNEIQNQIWVGVDETTDTRKRYVANVVIGDFSTEVYLLNTEITRILERWQVKLLLEEFVKQIRVHIFVKLIR